MTTAIFRFHAELNAFIAPAFRQRAFSHPVARDATVKHMIEVFGVPHTEVALVLVNDAPASLAQRVEDGDRIAAYPHVHALAPAGGEVADGGTPRFIADAHLGRLARRLRMLGFDVLYRNSYSDAEVARIAAGEGRVVLTRDRDLLIRRDVLQGCYVHATATDAQLVEVLRRYRIAGRCRPFSRCLVCNGRLRPVARDEVAGSVPPTSLAHYERFLRCAGCGKVLWEGTHVERMRRRIADILLRCGAAPQAG